MFVVLIHRLLVQPAVDARRLIALPPVSINGAALVVKEDATAVKYCRCSSRSSCTTTRHGEHTATATVATDPFRLVSTARRSIICYYAYLPQSNSSRTRITTMVSSRYTHRRRASHHDGVSRSCQRCPYTRTFSELIHLFALSAALQIAIQSYTPPTASVGCEQVRS